MVNYLIFAGILYSKQIKLPTLLAIEPEPKTLARQTVSEAQHQTKQCCCQLKVLYKICAHFCPVYGPDYKVSKLVVGLMAVFTISCIYPLKNIKITIYTYCYNYDVCYGINSVVYGWQIGQLVVHLSAPNTTEETRKDSSWSSIQLQRTLQRKSHRIV